MASQILVTRETAVATVELSNPGKLNAITTAMWGELKRAVDALSAEDGLRCVVLRGAGRDAFAAGADIEEFATVRDNAEQGMHYHRELVRGALEAVAACRHPTIAMIHGPCIGGGFEIACQCDLRLSGRSGRFGLPINRLGFAIAYDELAALLPLLGRAVTLEILIEGRVWDAQEAHAKGLLTRVVPDEELDEECRRTVERRGAPLVSRWHKVRAAPRPQPAPRRRRWANFAYFATEDYREGMAALRRSASRVQGVIKA
jgi:enoyl-CoA hydratase/carnithine racemase